MKIKKIELEDAIAEAGKTHLKPARTKTINSFNYETVVSSGCDFAIRKTGKSINKILICFVSQGLFCIYDEKLKTKKIITSVRDFISFFNDKKADDIVLPAGIATYITFDVNKQRATILFTLLLETQKNQALKFIFKKNVANFQMLLHVKELSDKVYTFETLNALYDESSALCASVISLCHGLIPNAEQLNFILSCYNSFGLDITKNIFEYGMLPYYKLTSIIDFSKYNIDGSRFADFLKNSIMKQNISDIKEYLDYLDMAKALERTIENKYPDAILSMHDKYLTKLNETKNLKNSYPEFEDIVSDSRDYTYENQLDDFAIVMPKIAQDLVVEGTTLGHCVSSYAPKVIAGDCMVVFMRLKSDKTTPYLTVEITKDKTITEIEGANKRTELSDDEIVFLKAFARAFGLEISAQNALRAVVRKKATA